MANKDTKGFWTGQGMGAITLKTYGFDALDKALKKLPGDIQQKCVEGALKAGGKETIKAVKARIGNPNGPLARSVTIRLNKKTGTNCLVQLGPFLKTLKYGKSGKMVQPFYGHMVEWGTKAHHIPKKRWFNPNRKPLLIAGGKLVWDVDHPGYSGKRPFATGFDESRSEFLDKFGKYVDKYITKYIKKHAPKITKG